MGRTGIFHTGGEDYAALVTRFIDGGHADLAVCVPPGSALYVRGRTYLDQVQWVIRQTVPYDYAYRPVLADGDGTPALEGHWRPV